MSSASDALRRSRCQLPCLRSTRVNQAWCALINPRPNFRADELCIMYKIWRRPELFHAIIMRQTRETSLPRLDCTEVF